MLFFPFDLVFNPNSRCSFEFNPSGLSIIDSFLHSENVDLAQEPHQEPFVQKRIYFQHLLLQIINHLHHNLCFTTIIIWFYGFKFFPLTRFKLNIKCDIMFQFAFATSLITHVVKKKSTPTNTFF